MKAWIEWRNPDDPRSDVQPRYDKLVRPGPGHFTLVTRAPAGTRVSVRLAPLGFRDSRTR